MNKHNCQAEGYPPVQYTDRQNRDRSLIKKLSIMASLAVLGYVGLSSLFTFILLTDRANVLYFGNEYFRASFDIFLTVICIGIPFYVVYAFLKKRMAINILPLGKPGKKSGLPLIIIAGFAACLIGSVISAYISVFFDFFGVEFTAPNIGTPVTVPGFLMNIVRAAIIPALIEEFAMRGVVMQPLRRFGDVFAILMSSFVFALMHGNMVQIPFAFVAGIALGYAVIATGSVWTGIIIHTINNLLAVTLEFVQNSVDEDMFVIISNVAFGAVILPGIAAGVIYYMKYKPLKLYKNRECPKKLLFKNYFLTIPMLAAIGYMIYVTILFIDFSGFSEWIKSL